MRQKLYASIRRKLPAFWGGIFFLAFLVIPAMVTPSLSSAAEYMNESSSSRVGGSGGRAFWDVKCNPGEVMIGVEVRYGSWMDAIRARCRRVTINGTWAGTTRPTNNWAGNQNGGTQRSTSTCLTNEVVSGISVQYGSYVHRIMLICSRLRPDALHDNSIRPRPWVGQTGPRVNRTSCPPDIPAIGLAGRDGSFVDSVGLQCGKIRPGPSTLRPLGGFQPDPRPTFTWNIPSDGLTRSFRLCIGTGRTTIECSGQLPPTTTTFQTAAPLPNGTSWGSIEACNGNGCSKNVQGYARN